MILISLLRIITGEATRSKQPPTQQHWKQNVQAGGGAVIPCSWQLKVAGDMAQQVVAKVMDCLPQIEGGDSIMVRKV